MNLLWSYAYARTIKVDQFVQGLPVPRLRFFADSGAHSARTLGIHIGVEDYAEWVKRWAPYFTVYANLDIIGAPQGTRDNQTYLEEVHGLSPMPVFHTGEPFDVLERYLADGYTYIALGKLLGNPPNVLRPWLTKCFQLADGRAVFHGFGMTTWSLLKAFPFYTVDSSSWGSAVRYGRLALFHQGRWYGVPLRDQDAVHRNRHVIDAYNLPYRALTAGGYDRAAVAGAAAASFYRAAAWLHRHHGPIELPPGKGYPTGSLAAKTIPADGGAATYLAEAAEGNHKRHAAGLSIYLADTVKHYHHKHAAALTKGLA
jgi:hypothetical protein